MVIHRIVAVSTLVAALAAPLAAQAPDPAPDFRGAGRGRGNPRVKVNVQPPFDVEPDALYDQAREAIENSEWTRALAEFDRVIGRESGRADAAMYWKAYAQSKLAQSQEALQTIREMSKQFAASPWVRDARALEVEIRQAFGQPVSADLEGDEELKLLALRGVMQTDPDKGLPIIEKMLSGSASPRVRDRALFVLSQSRSPRAHDIMAAAARNNANPELQRRAIRYLGFMGNADDRDLPGIYRASTDTSVKRTVMNTLFMQRNAKALVDLAKGEKDAQMKKEIVSKLSVMKAPEATDYLLELLK